MAKQTLAVKYRPKTFNEVIEQNAVKKILQNQLKNKTFQNAYLFCGPAGDGKALPMNTDILTPDGYIKMKDVKINDILIDGLGKQTKVIGVYPQGIKPVYAITFNDNSKAFCSDEHLWKVKVNNEYKVLKTLDLMDYQTTHYYIPTPIIFFDKKTNIPPFDLDTSNGIAKEYMYADMGIRNNIINIIFKQYEHKEIAGNHFVYISNKQTSDDFAFIVRSLGCIDIITYLEGKDIYEHYMITPKNREQCNRYITHIEYINEQECQCIKVESGDHTFIINDMIVTHNTTTARIFANELNNHQGNIIELDAASNNGIDDIRHIIQQAKTQSIVGEYKVFLLDECYTPDVEILTEKGFVRFDKLQKGIKVAQWEDNNITFVKPNRYIVNPHNGNVFDINGIRMTGKHVVPYEKKYKKWFKTKTVLEENYIKDLEFTKNINFILGGKSIEGKEHISNWDKLFIICQYANKYASDNMYNKYVFREDKELIKLCEELKLGYKIMDDKITFNVPIAINVKDYLDFNYTSNGARELLAYNKIYNPNLRFTNNLDYYYTLSILAGYNPTIIDNQLLLNENLRLNATKVTKNNTTYTGKVYCVEVPSNKIIVRYNGFTMVNGNCHALSNNAWQALLKIIEEPPAKTMFLMCTTDPQKIPNTILSRIQRYDFKRVSQDGIYNRLKYVLEQEQYGNIDDETDKSLMYITKLADGGMRDALTYLDKCLSYGKLNLKNTVRILGTTNYDIMIKLTDYILSKDKGSIIETIEKIYAVGRDLKTFAKQYTVFLLDIQKYNLLGNFKYIQIPETEEYKKWLDKKNDVQKILDSMISLDITYSAYPKADIEICLLKV